MISEAILNLKAGDWYVIEFGPTGSDWEPDATIRYFAQAGKAYAFGPTVALAVATLKDKLETTSNAK